MLAWGLVVLFCAAGLLLLTRPPRATVWVAAPATPQRAEARCPKGTLEDLGACVPVPQADPSTESGFIPKRPELPTQLDAYLLPVSGSVELVESGAMPVPEALRLGGQCIAQRPDNPVELTARKLRDLGITHVLDFNVDQGWLLSSKAPAHGQLLLLAGLSDFNPLLLSAGELPQDDTPVARVPGVLWLAVRQLRLTQEAPSPKQWSDAGSIAVDPRNALPLRGTSDQSSE